MNRTQKRILNAAFEVLSHDLSAPLEKIAEVAGVTRMTLHRHFNGRKALIKATGFEMISLGNRIIDSALALHEDPRDQLKEIVMQTSQFGERYYFLIQASGEIEDEEFELLVQEMDDRMTEIYDTLRKSGFIRNDIPTVWIHHLYGGMMTAAWSAFRYGTVAPKDIPSLAWLSFSKGIFDVKEINCD